MEAKDKAKELVNKFSFICSTCDYEDNAKQYALLAVDLAIESTYFHVEFLKEVKNEINKL